MVTNPDRHVKVLDDKPTGAGSASSAIAAAVILAPLALLLAGLYLVLFLPTDERTAPTTTTTAPAPTKTPAPPQQQQPAPREAAPSKKEAPKSIETKKPRQPSDEDRPKSDIKRQSVAPPTPWRPLPATTVLTRIGVGSCLSQRHPQPIWDDVLALKKRPDLFLMIGDNVYGDVTANDTSPLFDAYTKQGSHPDFSKARAAFPFLAVWDDHDYGVNDGGVNFKNKQLAARLFSQFWQIDTHRAPDEGVYYSKIIGPPGRHVQFIFLDTRTHRSPLKKATEPLPYWGHYEPRAELGATILGKRQWAWLENQLGQKADLRIIVSSIQVLSNGHGFERWGNFPLEQSNLFNLIALHDDTPTMLLSGDRHMGALYEIAIDRDRRLPELTTSSLNRSYGPSKDLRGPELVSDLIGRENFATIDIDWQQREIVLSLRGRAKEVFHTAKYTFDELR